MPSSAASNESQQAFPLKVVAMKNRLQIAIAVLAVAAGGLLWAGSVPALTTSTNPGSTAGAAPTAASPASTVVGTDLSKATDCLDLPISSALIDPASCWDTGPASMLVAGTSPGDSTKGAVAVISGQTEQLAAEPGSGTLKVLTVQGESACLQGTGGDKYSLDLEPARLTSLGATACPSQASQEQTTATDAQLTSDTVEQSSSQVSSTVPPPVTPSYYEYYAYVGECTAGTTTSCPLYSQGQATVAPSGPGIVVLDFGAPCSTLTSPVAYGTQLFEGSACTPDSSLQQLMQEWIDGYESVNGAGTPTITLAAGTSNSENGIDPGAGLPASLQLSASGWYQLVTAPYTHPGAAPIVTWGASDVEEASSGWWDSSESVSWVQDYSGATGFSGGADCSLSSPGFLADYGDDIVGGSGSDDGWSAANVYAVSQGIAAACALPEVYYDSMASEWSALSQAYASASGSPGIVFTGVMVEAVAGTLSASSAWSVMEGDTGQSPGIPALTQIAPYGDFQVQGDGPQVTGISPSSGPAGGGTEVTVSGANLGGAEQVYFGQVPALSFSVNSATSLTATAPAGAVGAVNLEVETASGSSSAVSADQFFYSGPPCTSVAVDASPSTVDSGANVVVSVSAACPAGSTAKYSYFTKAGSSGSWTLKAAWIGSNWTWSTAGLAPGAYQLLAWASDGPYTVPQVQEAVAVTVVASVATVAACSQLALSAPSPAAAGTSISVSAVATCPSGSTPKYSYFTRAGTSGGWTLRAAWVGPSWSWSTLGLAPGTYQVLAWASDGPYTLPQLQQAATVSLTGAPACTGVNLSLPASGEIGSKLTAAASGQCPAGSQPKYSFFTRTGTAGTWKLRAAWVGSSWSWSTVGLPAGASQVLVWVSDGPYTVPQAETDSTVTLSKLASCSSVSVAATPADPGSGHSVTVSAKAVCLAGAAPKYSYFLGRSASGPWILKDAWVGSSWTLATTSLSAGTYYVLAWASSGPFTVPQVEATTSFRLGGVGACTAVSTSAGPSPVAAGSSVSVHASATCPAGASPEYSYFTSDSATGPWTLRDGWTGGSWSWSTAGLAPGTYHVLVWASDGPYTVPQVEAVATFTVG